MARNEVGETLVLRVYQRLRADIIAGRLTPGTRLLPSELCAQFGVSSGVIREALASLAAKDLVVIETNRSYHVVTLSPERLLALAEVRKLNEGAALRLSILHGGIDWESQLIADHHRLERLSMGPPHEHRLNDDWIEAHSQFHLQLLAACGLDVLLEICARLSDSADLYRGWASAGISGVPRDVSSEHRALLEAALDHDADRAVAALEQHIDLTASILLKGSLLNREPTTLT